MLSLYTLSLAAQEKKSKSGLSIRERLTRIMKKKHNAPKDTRLNKKSRESRVVKQAKELVEKTQNEAYITKIKILQKELKPHSAEIFDKITNKGLATMGIMDALKVNPEHINIAHAKRYFQNLQIAAHALGKDAHVHFTDIAVALPRTEEPIAYVVNSKELAKNPDEAVSFSSFRSPRTTPVNSPTDTPKRKRRGTPYKY